MRLNTGWDNSQIVLPRAMKAQQFMPGISTQFRAHCKPVPQHSRSKELLLTTAPVYTLRRPNFVNIPRRIHSTHVPVPQPSLQQLSIVLRIGKSTSGVNLPPQRMNDPRSSGRRGTVARKRKVDRHGARSGFYNNFVHIARKASKKNAGGLLGWWKLF